MNTILNRNVFMDNRNIKTNPNGKYTEMYRRHGNILLSKDFIVHSELCAHNVLSLAYFKNIFCRILSMEAVSIDSINTLRFTFNFLCDLHMSKLQIMRP